MTVTQLGQSISKTARLAVCSWYAAVSTYQKRFKKQEPVNREWGHECPSLIGACGERRLGYLKKLMLRMIERGQGTQSIAACRL